MVFLESRRRASLATPPHRPRLPTPVKYLRATTTTTPTTISRGKWQSERALEQSVKLLRALCETDMRNNPMQGTCPGQQDDVAEQELDREARS